MPRADRQLLAAIVGAFLASEALALALGLGFDDAPLSWFWQYLDRPVLEHDLLRGLFWLHGQPPLFNLGLGLAVKLGPATPVVLRVAWLAMELALLLLLGRTLVAVGAGRTVAAGACALLGLQPAFVAFGHWLFYPLPVALLLVAAAASLQRFAAGGGSRWAHGFAWLLAATALVRSTFHLAWVIGAVAAVALVLPRERRRALLVAAIAPVLLVHGWYLKNRAIVDVYGPSSWTGMHLARGWDGRLPPVLVQGLVATGALPPEWARQPFGPPAEFAELGWFAPPPAGGERHPAIDEPYKLSGEPNYNHGDYAAISARMLAGDRAAIRRFPGVYAHVVWEAWGLFLDPGPTLPPKVMAGWGPALPAYRDVARRITCLGASSLWLWPVVVVWALVTALRRPRRDGGPGEGATPGAAHPTGNARRATLLFAGLTLAWLGVITNLLEFGENARVRFEGDGLWALAAGAAVSAAVERVRRRWPARATGGTAP